MRIKSDFVTNSSSVSFCGWGIKIRDVVPEKLWKRLYEIAKSGESSKFFEDMEYEQFIINGYVINVFEDYITEHFNLDLIHNKENECYYIGVINNRRGEKPEVPINLYELLINVGFDNIDIEFIDEEWHDG